MRISVYKGEKLGGFSFVFLRSARDVFNTHVYIEVDFEIN